MRASVFTVLCIMCLDSRDFSVERQYCVRYHDGDWSIFDAYRFIDKRCCVCYYYLYLARLFGFCLTTTMLSRSSTPVLNHVI